MKSDSVAALAGRQGRQLPTQKLWATHVELWIIHHAMGRAVYYTARAVVTQPALLAGPRGRAEGYTEMEKRFSENSSLLACISSCNPNSQNFLDPKELCSFAKFWGKDEEFCIQLKAQCDLGKSMFSKCKSTEDLYKELFSFGSFNELRYIVSVVIVMPTSLSAGETSLRAVTTSPSTSIEPCCVMKLSTTVLFAKYMQILL
uniref:Uncharacterized protein LOC114329695 n=1 Tax=Diabrotica virgifera virgifera TaxID=50390 RepID=A0A6P7FNZ7_DIAVI